MPNLCNKKIIEMYITHVPWQMYLLLTKYTIAYMSSTFCGSSMCNTYIYAIIYKLQV